jgi:Holliday junction DNA helicase RuvB
LNSALLQAEGGCLLIDEAHSLAADIQVSLLKVLQEGMIFLPQRNNGRVQTLKLQPFCLIAATTDEWALTRPLVDRFRLLLRFEHYGTDDLTTLVKQRARSIGVNLDGAVGNLIAARSKGVPRLAIRLLDACIRTMQAEAGERISTNTFERTCALEQIDSIGLDVLEQRYLQLLNANDGCLRLNVVASSLGLPRATVERSVEPFLIRSNLITKDDGGRRLTPSGLDHVRRSDCEEIAPQ